MKKSNSILRNNQYILISFFVTAALWFIIYFISQIGIFGGNTILRMDLYHQYCPLFAELYDKIKAGDFSMYSWESGLGSSFWGNYFNYMSSPIGFIVMLFGHKNVPEAIAAMIVIKGALSAASFTYYLKKSQHNTSISTISFGVLYSFCGYVLAYYWDIMWLDAVVLLPIVLLGIERIIDEGYVNTFVVSLALTMFTNYYMSFMVCIFSVIYFFYYYAVKYSLTDCVNDKIKENNGLFSKLRNNRFVRVSIRFGISALFTGAVMSVVLLPTYSILQACSATSSTFPNDFKTYFNFFDFFANHLSSLETTIRSSGDDVLPNVYCGLLTIILAPMYIFTKTISKKEKTATIIVLFILFLSFNLNTLNYIWHGLHFPNDLPYRFSFIYSFILLIVAYKTFIRLNEFTARQIGLSSSAVVAFIILITKLGSKNVESRTIYISLIFAVIYTLILVTFKDKRYEKQAVAMILCVFVCCEVIVADSQAIKSTITAESYENDYDEFRGIKDKLDTIEGDDTSYRMELSDLRTRMDGCWFGYNSVSVFSSMAYEATAKLEDRLGEMSNGINSYTYNPQTPVFNMMHSIKYVVKNSDTDIFSDSPYYTKVAEHGKYTAYKNNYYLPLAYGVKKSIVNWDTQFDVSADYVNPFIVQGDYFEAATGENNPFHEIEINFVSYQNVEPFTEALNMGSFQFNKTTSDTDGSATFYYKTTEAGNAYLYYNVDSGSDQSININTNRNSVSASCGQDYIIDLGYLEADETITVNVPFEANSGSMRIYACSFDKNTFEKGYNVLSDNTLDITSFDKDSITGSFVAKKDCVLFTSIPYDEGWKIIVDNEVISTDDYLNIGGGLLGINVSKGIHDIRFEYTVKTSRASIFFSLFSLIIFTVILLIFNFHKSKYSFTKSKIYCYTYEIRANRKKPVVNKSTTNIEQISLPPKKEKEFEKEIISPKNNFTKEIIRPESETKE